MYSNKMNNLRVRVSDGGGRRGLAQGFHLQYLYHRVAIISIFDGAVLLQGQMAGISIFFPLW